MGQAGAGGDAGPEGGVLEARHRQAAAGVRPHAAAQREAAQSPREQSREREGRPAGPGVEVRSGRRNEERGKRR